MAGEELKKGPDKQNQTTGSLTGPKKGQETSGKKVDTMQQSAEKMEKLYDQTSKPMKAPTLEETMQGIDKIKNEINEFFKNNKGLVLNTKEGIKEFATKFADVFNKTKTSIENLKKSVKGNAELEKKVNDLSEKFTSLEKVLNNVDNLPEEDVKNFKNTLSVPLDGLLTLELGTPSEKGEKTIKLPKNKYSDAYYAILDELEKHPDLKGSPIANGALAILAFMARFAGIADTFFSNIKFFDAINQKHQNEQFSKNEIENIINGKGKEDPDTSEYNKYNNQEASTKWIASKIGVEEIDDPQILAARLLHAEKNGIKCYESTYTLSDLKSKKFEKIPKGTILFFTKNVLVGETYVAYATGNGKEFEYFNQETKAKDTISINDISTLAFKGSFLPKFNTGDSFYLDNPDVIEPAIDNSESGKVLKCKTDIENYLKKAKSSFDLGFTNTTEIISNLNSAKDLVINDKEGLIKLSKDLLEKYKTDPSKCDKIIKLVNSLLSDFRVFNDNITKKYTEILSKFDPEKFNDSFKFVKDEFKKIFGDNKEIADLEIKDLSKVIKVLKEKNDEINEEIKAAKEEIKAAKKENNSEKEEAAKKKKEKFENQKVESDKLTSYVNKLNINIGKVESLKTVQKQISDIDILIKKSQEELSSQGNESGQKEVTDTSTPKKEPSQS